jgi:ubiquinone/menaquinone biosynthesis C-methylase UbiE
MSDQNGAAAAQARQLFDAKASTWSAKYTGGGRLTGRLAHLTAVVQDTAGPGCSVLDLGCGTGDLARCLARTGLQMTGCDISAQMLHRAGQADPTGTVEWTLLDPRWRRLPFADGTFEAIVASSVLEYVDQPADVLSECARVLRPGGVLLCTVPDPGHPVRWLERLIQLTVRKRLTRAIGGRAVRLDSYLAYLRISQNRRAARWWRHLARTAGLHAIVSPGGAQGLAPLRLLTFRRSCE